MNEDSYFLISCSEDGDVRVAQYTKEQLLSEANERANTSEALQPMLRVTERDPQCWGRNVLIIKGQAVQLFEKKVVKEFDVP